MPIHRHYLMFVHGVNTRERRERPEYADYLFDLIASKVRATNPNSELCKIPFYWGDVGQSDEDEMMKEVKSSPIYSHFYLKDIRENQIQQFIGDAALYTSRTCGARVLERLRIQAAIYFKNFNPTINNHVHLVTHSWGTVILLDALFAARWDDENAPGYAVVQEIRRILFGVEPADQTGLFVRSIHTFGSPLAMFSLMEKVASASVNAPTPPVIPLDLLVQTGTQRPLINAGMTAPPLSKGAGKTHDITDHLAQFLDALFAETKSPLPWNNYAHPGDLVAYPLSVLLPKMLNSLPDRLAVTDFLVQDAGPHLFENIDPLAIIRAGTAHGSYWHSNIVADEIARSVITAQLNSTSDRVASLQKEGV